MNERLTMPNVNRISGQGEVRIKDILETLWRYRLASALLIFVTIGGVTAASYLVPKQYEVTTIIAPATGSLGMSSSAMGSVGSGLAALVGMPLASDPKKIESIATLQSGALTEQYIRDNNLLPILFANKWDNAHSTWKKQFATTPTIWKASDFFRSRVRVVTTDVKTGLVTLSITWTDPNLAAQWANGLVRLANEYERDRALANSERNIAYLTEQASKTDQVGIRQAIYSLLESEYSKEMLAKGNNEYGFKIIDPAAVPEKESYPQKLVWILTAFFMSSSLVLFAAFCVTAWRTS